jgi:hypothetical protein
MPTTTAPPVSIIQHRYDAALQRQMAHIAAMAVVATVEDEGLYLEGLYGIAYDMRPALDVSRFADEEIEIVRDHVNLGLDAGWLRSVPGSSRYVVQVVWAAPDTQVPTADLPHQVAAHAAIEGHLS